MFSLLAARVPPGEACADVMQVMAKHQIAFACSTDPRDVAPFLRNSGYKEGGSLDNSLPKKSGKQAISSGDQGRPSFTTDSHLETHIFGNTDVQVNSLVDHGRPSFTTDFHLETNGFENTDAQANVSPNTLKVPRAIYGFSGQKDVKDTVIQLDAVSKSPEAHQLFQDDSLQMQDMDTLIQNPHTFPSETSVFGHGQLQAPDFTSTDSPFASTKIIPDAKFIQQTVEKVPMGASISTKQPEVKEEYEQSSSVNKLQPDLPNGATQTPFSKNSIDQSNALSMSPEAHQLPQDYYRKVQDMDTLIQKPPPFSSGSDVFGHDQEHSSSILATPEYGFGRGDVVTGANPEPMDFDMPPISSPAPMSYEELIAIFDGIKPPIDLDAPRLFLGDIDLTEEFVEKTAVKLEMEDEADFSDAGQHLDPKNKEHKPKGLAFTKAPTSNKKAVLKKKSAPGKKAPATTKKSFTCEVCQKVLHDRTSLKNHRRIHTGEKPFECDVCHKHFSIKQSLTFHMRTHTGEKPFECDVCKIRLSRRNNLYRHMRTHTGVKPYECEDCDKKFADKHNLKIHCTRYHS